jgi:hypothetical protein
MYRSKNGSHVDVLVTACREGESQICIPDAAEVCPSL